MMTKSRSRGPDWWIPWSFVGIFAVMLVANGALLYFAFDSWTGISTEDAYQKGLSYNTEIAEAATQQGLSWRGALSFAQTDDRRGRVDLTLEDRFGTAIDGAAVSAMLVRPTHDGYDFQVFLASRGGGRYSADIDFPLAGQWELRLVADHERGLYRMRERLLVQ